MPKAGELPIADTKTELKNQESQAGLARASYTLCPQPSVSPVVLQQRES
jgi:hypothetical protein